MSINCSYYRRESGAAALIVVVVLVALLTITVITVGALTTAELKSSSNLNRAKEAFAAAQGGLDRAAAYYLSNSATVSSSVSSVSVGSLGASYGYGFTVSGGIAVIQASGVSGDGTANAVVEEQYGIVGVPDFGKLVPLLATTNVPTGGTYSIVANPNSGGEGVPVSVWSPAAGAPGNATWQSCELDEYINLGGYDCGAVPTEDQLCESNELGCEDFVLDDCAPDPFEVLFGRNVVVQNPDCSSSDPDAGKPILDVATVRDSYKGKFECASGKITEKGETTELTTTLGLIAEEKAVNESIFPLPVVWIEGDCSIGDVGTLADPVIIIVEGDMTINGNGNSYGIFFGFTDIYSEPDPWNVDEDDLNDVSLSGGGTVNGSVMVNGHLDNVNGTGQIVYSKDVLDNLAPSDNEAQGLARYLGTWNDLE